MKRIALLTVLVCLLLVVGCSRGLSPSVTESSGLKPLAVFYGRYQSQHRGKPPEKESEFRKFLDALPASELLSFNVKSIDEILVSPRDHQPYTILYGFPKGPPEGPGGVPIIAYEQTGVGGRRLVASSLGGVEEVDEARFQKLVPSAP